MVRYTVAIATLLSSAGLAFSQPAVDWSGAYLGATVGLENAHDDINVTGLGTSFNPFDMNSAVFGGFVGYNMQSNNLVYGMEAAIKFGNLQGRGNIDFGDFINTGWTDKLGVNGSLHARVGVALDRAMLYVAAGPSLLSQEVVNDCLSCGGSNYVPLDWKKTRLGLEFGAGIDFAATENLILRIEYIHGDYGRISLASDSNYDVTSAIRTDAVTIGAAYKF